MGTIVIPSRLPRAAGRALASRNLITAARRGSVLCGERTPLCLAGRVFLCPLCCSSAVPLLHTPGWGSWGAAASPPQLCTHGGYRERILGAHLLQGKMSSPEQSPQLGRALGWPSFWTGRCNTQGRGKRGNSAFWHLFSLSWSCLCIPSAGSAGGYMS